MGQTPPPDEVTRRQPHPTADLMAPASQYHRGAVPSPPPHYRHLPAGHEHMYANIAWHGAPHLLSRPVPAPRADFQRYLDYAHAGPSDYVNPLPSFHQQELAAGYLRPAPQEWATPLNATSFPQRQLSYVEDDVRATTVPHPNPPTRHHHDTSAGASMVPFSAAEPLCQAVEQLHVHLPDHSNHLAGPLAPPLTQAPTLASVASLLNHPNSTIHVNAPHELAQTPPHWPTVSNSNLAQSYPAHLSANTSSTLAPAVAVTDPGHLPASEWGPLEAQVSNTAYPLYGQMQQQAEPDWPLEEAPLVHHHAPNVPTEHKPQAQPRRGRSKLPKKSLKKVPATYKERRRKSKISKREGPLGEATRAKTHKMRKLHLACTRCKFYKSGCDEGDPCQKCTKVMGNTRSYHLPCRRDNIVDTHLVRHCNGRLSQEEGEFSSYEWMFGSKLYSMDIQWILPGYGPISSTAPLLRITYREYYPNKQLLDTTVSMWRNVEGAVKVVEQPAYAIYDTAKFMSTFEQYFSSMQTNIEAWIFSRVRNDEIAWRTYDEVRRLRNQKPRGPNNLLDLVMRIQCLSVVSQGYGIIATPNVPGVREYDFAKMGRSTYEAYDRKSRERPLTAAINHQMDVAALKCLRKLEKECAKQLNKLIFQMKTKPWYEIFLALYVLFWNLEYIHSGAKKYMSAKNGTAIQHQVSSVISNQLKKWDFTFDVLMYHWLMILRDFKPLMLARENPEELRLNGHVDAEGFQYLVRVVQIIDQNKSGRSTAPYVGYPSTHDSLSSVWISALFKKAASDDP